MEIKVLTDDGISHSLDANIEDLENLGHHCDENGLVRMSSIDLLYVRSYLLTLEETRRNIERVSGAIGVSEDEIIQEIEDRLGEHLGTASTSEYEIAELVLENFSLKYEIGKRE